MQKITLPAEIRSGRGKATAKKTRRQGRLPAVLYGGKGKDSLPLTVGEREFREILKHHTGENLLIELQIAGEKKPHSVLIQEIQKHPYKDIIYHLDFLQVAMDRKVRVQVALNFQGEPLGGAALETHLRRVEVECLPGKMPEEIPVDVSGLEAGQSLHLSDLKLPAGVVVLAGQDELVAAAVAKAESEPQEPAAESESSAAQENLE